MEWPLIKQSNKDDILVGVSSIVQFARKNADYGPALKEAVKIDDATLENIYALAYQLYNQNKLDKAWELFYNLIALDIKSYKYTLGAAVCAHKQKRYGQAISCYALAAANDVETPIPYYYSGECAFALNHKSSALTFYKKAIEVAGDKKEFENIKQQATLICEGIGRA